MNLDLDQLGCSHADLVGYFHMLKKLKPEHIYVLAMDGKLQLTSCNVHRGHANTRDRASVFIPYKGKRMEGFVETKVLTNALKSSQGTLVFDKTEKPFDWPLNLGMRINELQDMLGKNIQLALEYLLRVKFSDAPGHCQALIVTQGEITATNGHVMHIDQSLPNMLNYKPTEASPGRRLLGLGAASALMHAARKTPAAAVKGGWQNQRGVQGFYFKIPYGKIEVVVTSQPVMQAIDTSSARAPGDENNAAFTVYADHLLSTLKFVRKDRGKCTVTLRLEHQVVKGSPVLRATPFTKWANEYGVQQLKEGDSHDLICNPTNGFEVGRYVELDTDYLLEAVQDLGPHIQFILPSHPVDGLAGCHINPVYITGRPGRFAVISPCCDAEEVSRVHKARKALEEAA